MKQYLEYNFDKLIPCTAEAPRMHIQQYGQFNYHWEWKPLTIQINSEDFHNDKPTSFNIIKIDNDGIVIEKWTIGDIKEYKKNGSNTIIKFGFALCNY